jgi:4-amino-4-deoxy-L-arabinose transferase-like glycosyltransferase
MSTTIIGTRSSLSVRVGALRLSRETILVGLGLVAIVALAAALLFGNIEAIGQSNTYYTAAVESMLQSWHNFFYVAAEPGGSVSVDKPPVGLWIEALSAYFLGVSGFAVVLPQILAGLASIVLLFHLVRRSFGNIAGLLAALALAVTPVAIAVERNNTPDGVLILTLLLAAWAFIKATETSRLRYLLLGAVLVGVGFNIKMLQAYLPLPAFYALYFLGASESLRRKIVKLTLTTALLLAASLSWAIAVDLTPADQRPYVGSSDSNSVLDLMLGYNGLQRLIGMNGGGNSSSARTQADGQFTPPTLTDGPGDDGGAGNNAGGMFNIGQAGILRMFQSGLAAEASWLLPFGLIMFVAMAASVSWWKPQTALHRGLILWGGWLLTCVAFFSVASFFHQYYLATLGPPLAALIAMGVTFLWRWHQTHPFRAALLMFIAAGVTLAYQVYAVAMYQSLGWWMALPVTLGLVGLGLLLIGLWRKGNLLPKLSFALVAAALFIVPTVWSGLTTAYASVSGPTPQAYSGNSGNARQFGDDPQTDDGALGGGQGVNQTLLAYLQANTQDTKYLLVVSSSQSGAGYVLATGRPVLYAGGFSGSDPVIDGDGLAELVANGEVRYVLWGGGGGPGGGNTSITNYLQSSCAVVTDAGLTAPTTTQGGDGQFGDGRGGNTASTLYQCGP